MSSSYDYVIVGAGSAGCVLAYRLGEDPGVRIAVIEAGPADTDPQIHVPFAFGALLKSRVDWDLVSEPEPGLDLRRNYIPRGKVLGGSSSLNAMIYIRGNRLDYDEWAADGADGWGYEDVLPYFRRAEDNERGESRYHGVGGPLSVTDARSPHPLVDTMIAAALESGMPANDDHNGEVQDGAGRDQFTIRDGRRCSTAVAYLEPAVARGNVDVFTNAHARASSSRATVRSAWSILRNDVLEELACRARGARLRRRLPLAAAAHAVRHRPAGATSPRWGSRSARTCPSARTCRTTRSARCSG